jgi:hypothetical protein
VRLAYADPPYIGRAYLYREHPDRGDYNGPARHVELMAELDRDYDGWALSCSAPSLRVLLPASPERARVAVWVKPFCAYRRNVRIAFTYEPVIYVPARPDAAPTVNRDSLVCAMSRETGLVGAKPVPFCRWVLDLLAYVEGDDVADLFPGTGVLTRVLAQRQLWAGFS